MNGAVRPRRQFQLAHAVLQSALHRGFLFGTAVRDEKRSGDPDLHRIEAASGRFDGVLVYRDRLADIRWRGVLAEQQIVTLLRDPADRALAAGAHPDRRVGLLRGRRLDDDAVETPIPAAMRKRFFGGPRLDDNVEGFVEPCVGLFHRHAEPGEFVVAIALADAEIEPAPGEKIEGCRLLRQQHRIVPGQHDDRRSEPQAPGARAEPGQQVERRRDLAVAGKMVLDDKGSV